LHSIRIYLDQEITNGGFGIAKWLDARKEIDTILKKIPAMQRADSTYQQYTDMLFNELGVYFTRLSKLPENTRVENLATQFLNSTVSTKSIIEETRRIMKSNPEYAGLWEDLIGLKFGLALDRAFKNPTAETAGMNVWKNLSNELAENAPLGKNLRIALNDQPEKLESFVNFVRAARLAGNASNTPSPTQIFQAIEKGIRTTVWGLHQLSAIGGAITLANKANARIGENAYREILKKLTSAFMTVKGIDEYNLYTDSFTRALEGSFNAPKFTTINNLGLNAYSASQPEGANAAPAEQMMVPKPDRQISAPANLGLMP